MRYTPRQLHAFLFLAGRRKRRETAEALALHTLAARGDPAEVKKRLKDLDDQ